ALAVQPQAPATERIVEVKARERRLARRVAVHEAQRAATQARSHACAHEKVQPLVAAGLRAAREALLRRGTRELGDRRAQGIEPGLAAERLGVAHALGACR